MTRIITSTHEGVATITLNDPERRNALDPDLAEELAAAIRRVDAVYVTIPVGDSARTAWVGIGWVWW